jgi:hypothetical protein
MNKKSFFSAMLVFLLAFGLVFVSCGAGNSKLVGTWEKTAYGYSTLELFKDGTGTHDGSRTTWRVENKRLIIGNYSFAYELVGSTLTLNDGDGDAVYKKQ